MIREYVEGHEFNRVSWNNTLIKGKKLCFVRGCIRCNGKNEGFVVWGNTLEEANEDFNTYLNPDCNCVQGSDVKLCHIRG